MTSCMTWLVPAAGPERDRLAAVIAELAAGHGGPVFAPHVTLAGVVEAEPGAVTGVLERPAAGMPPFEVRLTEVGHEPVFFRSLYLRAEPSVRLTVLHEAARRALGLGPAPYLPHLSLLYADARVSSRGPCAGHATPGTASRRRSARSRPRPTRPRS